MKAYPNIMELSYSELKKRDVINVSDGRSLGNIINLTLEFPKGELTGIIVPGRKTCPLVRIFDKTELYIDVTRILKIGNDVILVDLRGEEVGNRRPHIKPCPPKPCPPNACHDDKACKNDSRATCEDILKEVKFDGSDY